MTVERHMLDRAFTGEKIDVRVTIQNHSLLPLPWLQVQEKVPPDLKDQPNYRVVMSVGGHAQATYDYRLYCKRRGYYPLGPLQLTAGDLFGFNTVNWEELGGRHVTVYPQVLPLEKLGLPSRSPFGALPSRQRLFEDPARMAGVRDYVTGDSLRYVHWKASAHEDSLLVKKFQPAIALDVTIALDLNRAAYEPTGRGIIGYSEWAITVAASLASYVVDQRQPVGLICGAARGDVGAGRGLAARRPDLDAERSHAIQPPVPQVHDVALAGTQHHGPGLHEPVRWRRPGHHLQLDGLLSGVQHHDRQVASRPVSRPGYRSDAGHEEP
jgi:uncharacterized protein (DUF58 family)